MNQISSDFEKYGGSYLISNENYEKYINGVDNIGRPDGQFMAPSNQVDDLLQNYPNNPREWERQLGLEENSLGNSNIRRVDVYNPQNYNPRLPTSDLSGANDKFLEGQGKVPGGQDECVINRFPNPESNPNVGKISEINNGHSHANTSAPEQKSDKLSSDKVANGGGARAPNGESGNSTTKPVERGAKPSQNDNPPSDKSASSERGHKPSPADNEPQPKSVERGSKPAENEIGAQSTNPTVRGEKPQETPQGVSDAPQTQRGTPPGQTGGEDFKASSSTSGNPTPKTNAANPDAAASVAPASSVNKGMSL